MDTNINKTRALIKLLLDQLDEHCFFDIGGDIIIDNFPDGIHLLFDSGDTDVVIKFEVSDFRFK